MQLHLPTEPDAREHTLRSLFTQEAGWELQQVTDSLPPAWRGGRSHGLLKRQALDAKRYSQTRNFTDGAVTGLSPYLRHGCLSLEETVNYVKEKFGDDAEKLVFELAWRDYWQQVWHRYGDRIFKPIYEPVVMLGTGAIPDDVIQANTGLPCMDSFIHQLADTGYLHNHARMWLAAYLIHWRNVDWKEAADWMYLQLLDGDFASNHLSWQWVASSFSQKPYYFNQDNLAKYTQNVHCASCKANCVFRKSYEQLATELFAPNPRNGLPSSASPKPSVKSGWSSISLPEIQQGQQESIVWVHDEMLSPEHPLIQSMAHSCFIFDPDYFKGWSFKRLLFIADALSEMRSVNIYVGNTLTILASFNQKIILTQTTHNSKLRESTQTLNIRALEKPYLSQTALPLQELSSFTRYWKHVAPLIAPNHKKNHKAKSNSLYCR